MAKRWFINPRPLPPKIALTVALLYTMATIAWALIGFLIPDSSRISTWLNIAFGHFWAAFAAYYWVAYVLARRARR